jgi:hypothetical protein
MIGEEAAYVIVGLVRLCAGFVVRVLLACPEFVLEIFLELLRERREQNRGDGDQLTSSTESEGDSGFRK